MKVLTLTNETKHGKAVVITDSDGGFVGNHELPFPLSPKHLEFAKFIAKSPVIAGSSFDFPKEDGFTEEEAEEILKIFGF